MPDTPAQTQVHTLYDPRDPSPTPAAIWSGSITELAAQAHALTAALVTDRAAAGHPTPDVFTVVCRWRSTDRRTLFVGASRPDGTPNVARETYIDALWRGDFKIDER